MMKSNNGGAPFTNDELSEIRSAFPMLQDGIIYMNHAAVSPLSKPVTDRMRKHLSGRSHGQIDTFKRDFKSFEKARELVKDLINAESSDRISFTQNTSHGLNIVAHGLKWHNGDHIILNDLEFPANVYPYLNLEPRGVKVDFIRNRNGRITPNMIENALRPQTRLVAISAVQFLSGFMADLKAIGELCKQRGIWFVVDGIQALGARRIDVQGMNIDALATGGHKWLMGPQGAGFLYLSESVQNEIINQHIGWLSVEEPWELFNYDQPLHKTARRYEIGTPNTHGIHGLLASLELMSEIGYDRIEGQILHLTGELIDEIKEWEDCDMYSPIPEEERAGIVTVDLPENIDTDTLLQKLKDKKLHVAIREGLLRIAPHYYNSSSEVEQATGIIRKAIDSI